MSTAFGRRSWKWAARAAAVVWMALGTAYEAKAQFPGDVYFDAPSVAIPAGTEGEMEIVTFLGAKPLGALQGRIMFDAQALEVTAVEPIDARVAVVVDQKLGNIGFVVLNRQALAEPVGTVSLMRLKVAPKGGAGARVPLAIALADMLGTDESRFGNFRGFSGEIVVVNPSLASASRSTLKDGSAGQVDDVDASAPLGKRVLQLRRSGSIVSIWDDGAIRRVRVRPASGIADH